MLQGFATIPRAVLHDATLSTDAKMVYLVLSSHVGAQAHVWPSHATIAETAGLSVATVKRRLRELRDRGLVEWETRLPHGEMQRSNDYRLIAGSTRGQVAHTDPQVPAAEQAQVAHPDPRVTQTPSSRRATPKAGEVTQTPGSRRATNEKEQLPETTTPAATQPATAETITKRAQRLTKTYTDAVPLSRFPAVMMIVKRAIDANYDDDAITAALGRLAAEGRAVTVDTLRYELEGFPRPKVRDFDAERRAAAEARRAADNSWMSA